MFDSISEKFTGIVRSFSGKAKITEKNIQDAVEEIKIALLEADVNLRVVRRFINRTMEEATGEKVLKSIDPGQQFIKIVYDKMVQLLGDEESQHLNLKGPDTTSVILMMGLQGSGKTTTAAKLAARLKKQGRRPLLVAADLVRPAAVLQLQVLGEKIDVPVYAEDSKDPVSVARNALAKAKRDQFDILIVDTSGRMHLDETMMDEIKRIHQAVSPDETLFVADAMTGQNAVTIAQEFEEKVGISGVILSKFDSDTRGGAALSLRSIVGKPIKFIGVGEKVEDLDPFYPERIASRILGMGDVVSLVEKAQETIDQAEAERMQEKMSKNTFDLQDYLDQLDRMDKMGSIDKIIDMIPGAKGTVSEDDIDTAEMNREKAIIQSMTYAERTNYRILGPTRRKRIARGSGTSVNDVNRMLKKFEKMRLTMKKFAKNKKYQASMLKHMGM
ncbi:MAG: signal recognition particle protein [Spirochaetae bacterium HGW-Spirochaetae-4]|jgi:signal recognition particle subunit SRP54|nr:MAG: signal recognition particle protein [Spirochaetes bacterium GWC2_52_13]PKL21644.1 MAG: signal recognition particle protein [Spirochaetae bacterium HGW-Spirochaetae-4]PKL29038.1 MAG: signal recognition particle protein [Spirochaetae bacterium HGW-Spirochaetae-2]HCG64827.1 signal recognition particle protein [Sphaerochaeta sp.]HCS37144.1 signal recognition particle protein [Sphaerochaeta sp.]